MIGDHKTNSTRGWEEGTEIDLASWRVHVKIRTNISRNRFFFFFSALHFKFSWRPNYGGSKAVCQLWPTLLRRYASLKREISAAIQCSLLHTRHLDSWWMNLYLDGQRGRRRLGLATLWCGTSKPKMCLSQSDIRPVSLSIVTFLSLVFSLDIPHQVISLGALHFLIKTNLLFYFKESEWVKRERERSKERDIVSHFCFCLLNNHTIGIFVC